MIVTCTSTLLFVCDKAFLNCTTLSPSLETSQGMTLVVGREWSRYQGKFNKHIPARPYYSPLSVSPSGHRGNDRVMDIPN